MKNILLFVISFIFCFVAYADDTDISVDDLSSGTEIILDGNHIDNNDNSPKDSEIEIQEIDLNLDEPLPGDEPINLPKNEELQLKPDIIEEKIVENKKTIKSPKENDSPDTIYTIQLAAFKTRERAFAFHWKISKKISNTRVDTPTKKSELYKVCCGTFPNYEEAKAKADKLKRKNINCFITKISHSKK